MDVHSVCDYIIRTARECGDTVNVLKLHRLLYYAQAWHLALQGEPLFPGKFQAWAQGPVNRAIYDRFAPTASFYSKLSDSDVTSGFLVSEVPEEKRIHLDRVLQVYGKYDETELRAILAHDPPWQEANNRSEDLCEREIDEDHMRRYCTVQYLVGWQENNERMPFGRHVFHLQANPDAASAVNWLIRESNAVPAGGASS